MLKALRSTYSFVFLDEFQDTTTDQYNLIKTCFKGSESFLTAVGDEKQRIMVWAGADRDIFKKFLGDFKAKEQTLFLNHRSNQSLVEVQKYLIAKLSNKESLQEFETNSNNSKAEIWSFEDDDSEAKKVASQINIWINQDNLKPSDICIIVKQKSGDYSKKLITELDLQSIDCRVFDQLQDLMSEEFITLVLAFFKVANSRSPKDFSNIYNLYREIRLQRSDVHPDRAFFKVLDNELNDFLSKLRTQMTGSKTSKEIEECIRLVIDFIGERKIKNLFQKYKQGAYLAEIVSSISVELEAIRSLDLDWSTVIKKISGEFSVPVMTIHKSKGLEYKNVVFLGLEDSAFWSYKNQPEETQCAFFVALSRAKDKIIFTFSKKRDFVKFNPQKKEMIKVFYESLEKSGHVITHNFTT